MNFGQASRAVVHLHGEHLGDLGDEAGFFHDLLALFPVAHD